MPASEFIQELNRALVCSSVQPSIYYRSYSNICILFGQFTREHQSYLVNSALSCSRRVLSQIESVLPGLRARRTSGIAYILLLIIINFLLCNQID